MVNEKIINKNFIEPIIEIKDNNLNNTLNYNIDLTKKFSPDNQGNNSLVKNRIYPPIGTIRNLIPKNKGGKKNKSRKRRQRKRNSTKKV
jgi:hypothetical protein